MEKAKTDLADFSAFLTTEDPVLGALIHAWPKLPDYVKQTIKTLMKIID